MDISSSFLAPDERGHLYLVFDTIVEGRTLFVGVVEGRLSGSRLEARTRTGDRAMDRLSAHSGEKSPFGAVHVVEIKGIDKVAKRFAEVFAAAAHGDTIIFLGADDACCAAILERLNVQARSHPFADH